LQSPRTIKGMLDFAEDLGGVDMDALRDGLEIVRLHGQVERVVEHDLVAWGLTARQVEIVESLYHNTDRTMTPADLSEEVDLTRSAMTGALDTLEKLGHTARGLHPSDRRKVAVRLTPSGDDFASKLLARRYERIAQSMKRLSQRERAVLISIYKKVLSFMADHREPERP